MKLFFWYIYFSVTFGIALFFISCTSNIELPPSPESLNPSGSSSSLLSSGDFSSSSSNGSSSSSIDGSSSSSNSSSSFSSESQAPSQFDGDEFIDQRDGKRYKYEIAPNGRVWMSENLNYSRGGTIGYCFKTGEEKETLGTPGENLPGCNSPYGRTYTYAIATDGNSPKGICPGGWHIPSTEEWEDLGNMSSSFHIKSGNFNTNTNWLPLGWKDRESYSFYWTSNASKYFAYYDGSYSIYSDANSTGVIDYFSVRCIMDADFSPTCGSQPFNLADELCVNGTKYPKMCGGKTWNPKLQQCSDDVLTCLPNLPAGYLCYENYVYQEITVDGKIWMTSNINGTVTYDWATAMNLPGCNSSNCAAQIQTLHKGICPADWHIPKQDEITTNTFFNGSDTWWTATQWTSYETSYAYYKSSGGNVTYSTKISLRPVRCVKN